MHRQMQWLFGSSALIRHRYTHHSQRLPHTTNTSTQQAAQATHCTGTVHHAVNVLGNTPANCLGWYHSSHHTPPLHVPLPTTACAVILGGAEGDSGQVMGDVQARLAGELEQHRVRLLSVFDNLHSRIMDARTLAAAACKPVSQQDKVSCQASASATVSLVVSFMAAIATLHRPCTALL